VRTETRKVAGEPFGRLGSQLGGWDCQILMPYERS